MKRILILASAVVFVMGVNGLTSSAGEAAAWTKCGACHNFDASNKVGPGLEGVIGRKAGIREGFSYKLPGGWTWDEASLREWMCNSKEAVKKLSGDDHAKTKMPPQKVCDPKDQDEVLAKLKG